MRGNEKCSWSFINLLTHALLSVDQVYWHILQRRPSHNDKSEHGKPQALAYCNFLILE